MHIQEINSYVVVFHGDRLLLLKRGNGIWEFPGGSVDWGEDPQHAAVREAKEEAGLVVRNLSFVTVTSATYKKGEDDKHSIYVVYRGETDSDDVRLTGEHKEHRWITLTEARFMKLGLNAEGIVELLE